MKHRMTRNLNGVVLFACVLAAALIPSLLVQRESDNRIRAFKAEQAQRLADGRTQRNETELSICEAGNDRARASRKWIDDLIAQSDKPVSAAVRARVDATSAADFPIQNCAQIVNHPAVTTTTTTRAP